MNLMMKRSEEQTEMKGLLCEAAVPSFCIIREK